MSLISVVLNVYRRPHTMEEQIKCILNQSVPIKPENIHIWYNKSGKIQPDPQDERINTYRCNWNTKFFGRFTIPLMCRTEYVAIFDDDIFPPSGWFQNCLESMVGNEGILGGSGVYVSESDRGTYQKVGWNGKKRPNVSRVDFVGHTWFFRQEWAKYMWYEKPYTWDNAEDMTFSYLAQKHGGINTFVPPHPPGKFDIWCTDSGKARHFGRDKNASWKRAGHTKLRSETAKHYIANGWKIVRNAEK